MVQQHAVMANPLMASLSRENCHYLAKHAGEAKRYREMVQLMNNLVSRFAPTSELTIEEWELFSLAHKMLSLSFHTALERTKEEEIYGNNELVSLIQKYRGKIARDWEVNLQGILGILSSNIFYSLRDEDVEKKIFDIMKEDCFKYLNEIRGYSIPTDEQPLAGSLSRANYFFFAKLATQVNRFEEAVQFMDKLVCDFTPASELTNAEQDLLSIAYKNVINPLRSTWHAIFSIEQEERSQNKEYMSCLSDYRFKIEQELLKFCCGIGDLIKSNLVPSTSTIDEKAFYLEMKVDYELYLEEIVEFNTELLLKVKEAITKIKEATTKIKDATKEAAKENARERSEGVDLRNKLMALRKES